jgi:predicted GTPase
MPLKRLLILGAAGGNVHCCKVVSGTNPDLRDAAFNAAQIPDKATRQYPAKLDPLYPNGTPVREMVEKQRANDGLLGES